MTRRTRWGLIYWGLVVIEMSLAVLFVLLGDKAFFVMTLTATIAVCIMLAIAMDSRGV
jgi:hypothetical protein